jgi:Fe-S cluster assembly protein SufD
MSPKSWAQSRPYLEIKANDVRCTHGATVGKIDREQMYYLRSRGIYQKEAEKLILKGFLGEVIDRFDDSKIKEEILISINKRLDNLLN